MSQRPPAARCRRKANHTNHGSAPAALGLPSVESTRPASAGLRAVGERIRSRAATPVGPRPRRFLCRLCDRRPRTAQEAKAIAAVLRRRGRVRGIGKPAIDEDVPPPCLLDCASRVISKRLSDSCLSGIAATGGRRGQLLVPSSESAYSQSRRASPRPECLQERCKHSVLGLATSGLRPDRRRRPAPRRNQGSRETSRNVRLPKQSRLGRFGVEASLGTSGVRWPLIGIGATALVRSQRSRSQKQPSRR
jgi:hypothetical protein